MNTRAEINRWEGALEAGDRVVAYWSKTVCGRVHTYHAHATVVRVNPLDVRVRPEHNGGDRRLGRSLTVPRALNRRRDENNRLAPALEPITIDDLGVEATDRDVRRAWLGMNEPQRQIALLAMNRQASTRAVHAMVQQIDPGMTALELCDALTLGRFHISKRDGQDLLDIIAPDGMSCHD